MDTTALLTEQALKKWKPILEHPELGAIKDPYRKSVTALMLENQQQALNEAAPYNAVLGGINNLANTTANGANPALAAFDPVMISLVRRAMPNLIAYDVCGVQPMTAPTGLIFCMKSRYKSSGNNPSTSQTEAMGLDEVNTMYSGTGPGYGGTYGLGNTSGDGSAANFSSAQLALASLVTDTDGATGTSAYSGIASSTQFMEAARGDAGFAEMGFSIERTSVIARSRALQASYSAEIAQDLKAVHGLDVETELANILTNEVLAEINREVVRTIYQVAKLGCSTSGFNLTSGQFDVQSDSDGRWSAERFRGLFFQIEREANLIAKETRRGKGNIIICSSDVASALSMTGLLESNQKGAFGIDVDDTGTTFVGTIGRYKVYIDPYVPAGTDFCVVGYKGTSQYDAGFFYCPYVPLQMVRAIDPTTFQPKIGFKTRYGIAANPFATTSSSVLNYNDGVQMRTNSYYRIFQVTNLHGITSA
jgi:hypothetical protein